MRNCLRCSTSCLGKNRISGDFVGRPVNTLLDEVLAPVDPDVFERHLSYYDSLYGTQAKRSEFDGALYHHR